ncbi:MAG: hypothetical protein ACRDS9_08270 [Pseudonocardiaceae bacterium]
MADDGNPLDREPQIGEMVDGTLGSCVVVEYRDGPTVSPRGRVFVQDTRRTQ